MRVLLCDDDGMLRSVLTSQLEERGHEVVAEADMALTAIELLERLHPDLAIVDLAMPFGTGDDVVDVASAQGCAVVVFTAYVRSVPGADAVVAKPDFAALEAAIEAIEASVAAGGVERPWAPGAPDRRRGGDGSASIGVGRGTSTAEELYAALAAAAPGDVLLRIRSREDVDADDVAAMARSVTRAQDLVATVRDEVFVLLVTGEEVGAAAVRERLVAAWLATGAAGPLQAWHEVVAAEAPPSDVFARLRALDAEPTGAA